MEQLSINIETSEERLLDFLNNPFNLRFWTVHRDLYAIEEKCFECLIRDERAIFAEIRTTIHSSEKRKHSALFSWHRKNDMTKSFGFQIVANSNTQVKLCLAIPEILNKQKQMKLTKLISIEFNLLKKHLENSSMSISKEDAIFLQNYHENLSFS